MCGLYLLLLQSPLLLYRFKSNATIPQDLQLSIIFSAACTALNALVCRGGFYGASDVYNLTPYSAHTGSYVRTLQQPRAVGDTWSASVYPKAIAAMHFKWHSGVLQRCPPAVPAGHMHESAHQWS